MILRFFSLFVFDILLYSHLLNVWSGQFYDGTGLRLAMYKPLSNPQHPPPYRVKIQTSLANPAIHNPPKNSSGTNGGGLTRSDCICFLP